MNVYVNEDKGCDLYKNKCITQNICTYCYTNDRRQSVHDY